MGRKTYRAFAVIIPALRSIGRRIGSGAGLLFDDRSGLVASIDRNGTRRLLGRLSAEEGAAIAGDLLSADVEGSRFRPLPLGSAHRAYTQGAVVFDDFFGSQAAVADIGSLPWQETAHTTLGTLTKVTDAAAGQQGKIFGVARLTTAASGNTGSTISLGGAIADHMSFWPPSDDVRCVAKMRVAATNTQMQGWAGLWSDRATYPDLAGANTISGVGFTARPAGSAANWFGLVRAGTAETAVNLGILADNTWHELSWQYTANDSVQFYVDGAAVGSAVTTNLPAAGAAMSPQWGLVTLNGTAKYIELDYYGAFFNTGDRF